MLIMSTRRSIPPGPVTPAASSKGGHTVKTSAYTAPRYFTTTDPRLAWEHFRPTAQRVDTKNLQYFRYDVHIAMHNVSVGLAAVEPFLAELAEKAPHIVQSELLEMPALGLGFSFAVGRCPPSRVPSKGEIAEKVAAITEPRELTVSFLRMFSRLHPEQLPTSRVAVFATQKGPLGMASDCVQVAGIFHEFASALAGKHPFEETFLRDMASTAAWLVTTLKPSKAMKRATPRTPESIERDQFASLYEARHDALRTAGVVLFGIRHVDEHVPPLYSSMHEPAAEEVVDDGETEKKPTG